MIPLYIADKIHMQPAINCHYSPAISTMGDGAGDSVVSGGDCVGGGPATEWHTILKLKLTLGLLVGSSN